jgi:DNA-binding NarL/FixJ family response regulator
MNLSAQERDIVRLVVAGLGRRDIARMLGLNQRAAGEGVSAVFKKFSVTSRRELASRVVLRRGRRRAH